MAFSDEEIAEELLGVCGGQAEHVVMAHAQWADKLERWAIAARATWRARNVSKRTAQMQRYRARIKADPEKSLAAKRKRAEYDRRYRAKKKAAVRPH